MFLSQQTYSSGMLKQFRTEKAKTASTPMAGIIKELLLEPLFSTWEHNEGKTFPASRLLGTYDTIPLTPDQISGSQWVASTGWCKSYQFRLGEPNPLISYLQRTEEFEIKIGAVTSRTRIPI